MMPRPAAAQTPQTEAFVEEVPSETKNRVGLDIYAFGQGDETGLAGNQFRAEAFQYGAIGIDTRFAVGKHTSLLYNGVLAYIENDLDNPLPPELEERGLITSATENILTLDTSAAIQFNPNGGPWTVTPGFFYHHQNGFVAVGPNLDLARVLAGGDAVVFANLAFRIAWPWWQNFDGTPFDRPEQYSTSFLLGWRQYWSRSWLTVMSAQFTRQDGRLHNTLNYVTVTNQSVVDPRDAFVRNIVQENLPTERTRVQINLRTKYTPAVGWALGADGSAYFDDWGILHFAVQPNVDFEVYRGARLNLWYRYGVQRQTMYFVESQDAGDLRTRAGTLAEFGDNGLNGLPGEPFRRFADGVFATQDSDLATFETHSPGFIFTFPIGTLYRTRWGGRLSGYGFYRTDALFAAGANAGVVTEW
ncbi:MAG: DUF3570 domain-containing protein [Myxococcota bacterium]